MYVHNDGVQCVRPSTKESNHLKQLGVTNELVQRNESESVYDVYWQAGTTARAITSENQRTASSL